MLLHALIAMLACWIHRHQEHVIVYVREENRLLKSRLKGHRLALTDADRRRLTVLAHPIDRKRLKEVATLVTVETLHRWYRCLVVQQGHGTAPHKKSGRPRVAIEIEHLVLRMAEDNASWGYRRLQGALANVGYHIDKITVRNILRRHHLDPAPQRRRMGMSWAQFVTIHWAVLTATDFFTAGRKPLAAVRTSALQGGRDLVTSCLQLVGLTRDGLLGMMMAWRQLGHRLGSGRLSWTRLRMAELETPWRGMVNRHAVGCTEVSHVFPRILSTTASRQRMASRIQPERDPPMDRCPAPPATPRRQWCGNSASGSHLLSASSVHHAGSQGRRQSRHGDACAPAVPAAA